MIVKDVERRTGGCEQRVGCKESWNGPGRTVRSFRGRAWREQERTRRVLFQEWLEDGKIAGVSSGVVSLGGASERREIGFVHEFGGGNSSAGRLGVRQHFARLLRSLLARGIPRSRTNGEFIALLISSPSTVAQEQASTSEDHAIRVSVDLVQLDAQVLDKKTHPPIGSLSKDDFELCEDGVPQKIAELSRD